MTKKTLKFKLAILTLCALNFINVNGQITTNTYVYSGAIQSFTVPVGVSQLSVDARGAGGGSVTTCGAVGGLGARMFGVVTVTPGQVISILVGQAGGNSGASGEGGGGGGSFIASGTTPLVIAGGGGGASSNIGSCGGNLNGVNASTTTVGTFNASGVIAGGNSGNGGTGSGGSGGGGGGFNTNGTSTSNANGGGRAFLNGGIGGFGTSSNGGFGGGGCGWSTGGNGGGGGGYSGGGTYGASPYTGGGGGGSYNIGTNQINTAGFQSGNGLITISYAQGVNYGGPIGGGTSTVSFPYTGSTQSYTVPNCVSSITFNVLGAKGGIGNPAVSSGGNGGGVIGIMTVTPGQVLQINVGGIGTAGSTSSAAAGGFNGGGAGGFYSGSYGGGGGGGASDIRISPYALANRYVVAAGGGGGAYNSSTPDYDRGGRGGTTTGEAGASNNVIGGTAPGGGGTPSTGGIGGFWAGYCTATNGSFGNGGPGGTCANSGGGGGGGYYGGGGGVWAGGGGGSNYTDPSITGVVHSQGSNNTNGLVTFTMNTGAQINSITATPSVLCLGNTATLSTGGMDTYTWTGVVSNNSIVVVTPTASSFYTVMATNSVGCVSGYSIFVYANPLPTIAVNSGSICDGQSFTIVPSGANSYTFEGGSAIVSPTANANYTVVGTSSVGCLSGSFATSNITVSALPTIIASSGSICTGQSYTIVPGGANTYTFQGGSAIVSPTINTTYTVAGTSSVGCVSQTTAISSVTVNQNPTITVNSGSICSGQSFTMVPNGANTYTFEGGNAIVSPTANVNYTVVGTNSLGCTSISSATSAITVVANPTISVNSGSICSGNSFTMVPSGADTYTFQGGNAIVSPTANASYTVVGTSTLTGCISPSFATSNVTVNVTPTVAITGNTLICGTGTNVLTGTGADTYSWSTGANTPTISESPTVTTNYTVVGTNTVGSCTNTFTTSILVSANPTVAVAGVTPAICIGSTVNLTASGANTYSWSNGPTTTTIAVTPTTNTSYSVVGTNTDGCVSNAVANVTVNALPSVSISASGTICMHEAVVLTANGADTYSWNTGATTQTISDTPLTTTTYTAIGTSSVTGCTGTISAIVVVDPCTGINTVASKITGLLIYPNPSNGEFTIELNNGLNKVIEVSDLTGRLVLTNTSSKDKVNVNITHLANGIYYVKIQSNNASEVIKVVKQ